MTGTLPPIPATGPAPSRRSVLAGAASCALIAGTPRILRAATRKRIVMIPFRGWEDACEGFKSYLESSDVDAELIVRDVDRDRSRIPGIIAEVKEMRPDLVYTWGTTTALDVLGPWDAAEGERFVTDIPAVFNIVTEPVGNGVVKSLADPGRNATGTLYIVPVETQLRAMASYLPFRKIGLVYNPQERNSLLTIAALEEQAGIQGFELMALPAALDADGRPAGSSIPGLLEQIAGWGADWLYIPPDTFLQTNRILLTDTALELGIPAFTSTEPYIRTAGALFGLVCRYYNIGQFTGAKAEQILRGAPAGSLPVETLNRFSLLVNMATARRLNRYPPMSILRIAEAVAS